MNCNPTGNKYIDPTQYRYQQERIYHWNKVAPQKANPKRTGVYYQRLLEHYYKFFIPPGKRILELGCGHGDLLCSLQPSIGVGVDFSPRMIQHAKKRYPQLAFIQADAHQIEFKEKFDIIILSDLVNDLWDVQRVFEKLRTS